ncbi:hypothetical protein CEXT_639801 [Caerostris extrusa]|uniref:Reverse transcriptase/retrotransposon-derived protein RNase H-like domain-containing protein n=1 Tax=Caerostris extrusa TaxID=172846 RepID=A0AAV4M380_CAEEX|nr:hypothetical protein CEXT_639801 [Caerostris extrusa]
MSVQIGGYDYEKPVLGLSISESRYGCASLVAVEMGIPFRVEADASDFAIGTSLSQAERLIAFFSSTLNKSEQNHSSIEKEAYAIVKSWIY